MNRNLHSAKRNKNDGQLVPGMRFGSWIILYYLGKHKNGRRTWMCRCICGKEKEVIENNLKCGTSKSCGCRGVIKLIQRNKKLRNNVMDINLAMAKQVISGYKADAKRRNYVWDLSFEKCIKLFNNNCFYCGDAPDNVRTTVGRKKNLFFKYNGIDRIDNTNGYVGGNVVSCCKKCNRAKDTMTTKEFLAHVCKIHENIKNILEY